MRRNQLLAVAALALGVATTACGGSAADAAQTAVSESEPIAASAPTPTGTVIEVKMITDDNGNYFEPNTIEARKGDVIRFVLVSGVHNVSLPADRNPGEFSLPQPSDYLQLPGQTYDLVVDLPAGEYYFQCDPHAALGMTGTITVTEG